MSLYIGNKLISGSAPPTPEEIGAAPSDHSHDERYYTESETDTKLNSKANSSHTHASSEVTGNFAASRVNAGTFNGAVVANSSGQTPATSLLRNSKLVATETNPTVNGEICWQYE